MFFWELLLLSGQQTLMGNHKIYIALKYFAREYFFFFFYLDWDRKRASQQWFNLQLQESQSKILFMSSVAESWDGIFLNQITLLYPNCTQSSNAEEICLKPFPNSRRWWRDHIILVIQKCSSLKICIKNIPILASD